MKKVLITGANSFVGMFVEGYLLQWPEKYQVKTVDTESDDWKELDFSTFDVVYHVSGIAHVDSGKIPKEREELYYKVNTHLTIDIAKKAKKEGVAHFIFMSSSIVYGAFGKMGKISVITKDTSVSPENCYGDSKLQAENGLALLEDETFKVAVLRCPMIYGKGGKGNFRLLEKIAISFPIFPKVQNERSMIYIGNLAEFVRVLIDDQGQGIFWPQNKEWSNTSEMVRMIAAARGKKILLVPGFGWLLKLMSLFVKQVNKAFGSMVYDKGISEYKKEYRRYTLEQSIKETERE